MALLLHSLFFPGMFAFGLSHAATHHKPKLEIPGITEAGSKAKERNDSDDWERQWFFKKEASAQAINRRLNIHGSRIYQSQ